MATEAARQAGAAGRDDAWPRAFAAASGRASVARSRFALPFAGTLAGRTISIGGIVLAACFGLRVAGAQDGAATGGTVGEVSARRRAELTPQQQIDEALAVQQRGANLGRRVQAMLDEARREGDVIRATCLDDKFTQINAHGRSLGDRVDSLQQAVQLGDEGRRNHEFTVITVLGQNLSELERASGECVGQDVFETGTTRVTTTIDPTVPETVPEDVPAPDVGPNVPFIPPPESPS